MAAFLIGYSFKMRLLDPLLGCDYVLEREGEL